LCYFAEFLAGWQQCWKTQLLMKVTTVYEARRGPNSEVLAPPPPTPPPHPDTKEVPDVTVTPPIHFDRDQNCIRFSTKIGHLFKLLTYTVEKA
jgi:hypothetical protein